MSTQNTPQSHHQIYLDNHATTPIDPKVLEVMLPFLTEHFGNAGSTQHAYGWKAKAAVDRAREQVASLIKADAPEIIFTSGATESIHFAILGLLEEQTTKRHVITSEAEHKATLEVCARAQKHGFEVTVLPVNRYGQVELATLQNAIRPDTALVTLLHGNNEIGSLNPIKEIGAICRERGIAFHVDAAQTVGKLPIDVREMNIDLLSLSSHKLYGPKGVGALFVSRKPVKIHLTPFMVGGGQERGLRGGTLNVPGIVGLGEACEISAQVMTEEGERLTQLRNLVIERVSKSLGALVQLNGHPSERLCNNVNFTIFSTPPDTFISGMRGIAYSSASACSSGGPSHVLKAIGQATDDPMATTVRFGLGRFTTAEEVETLIESLVQTVVNATKNPQVYAGEPIVIHRS